MIPALIIWLIHRYRQNQKKSKNTPVVNRKLFRQSRRTAAIIVTILFLAFSAHAQDRVLNYEIIRNGNKVGTLRFSESILAGIDYLKMESDVKTRFVFTFKAHALEEAVYCNGVLLRSSIFRQLNGNEKANKQHQAGNGQYIIHRGRETEISKDFPITYNMLSLYSREPVNVSRVYSDNFETFIAIQKIDAHKYKVTLPDGNYNYYCYKEGTLSLVEIHHTLYSANIVLSN